MEQRLEDLENFAELSRQLTAITERRQARTEEHLRIMAELHRQMALAISELDEDQRELAEDQRASNEIIQRINQVVAVMQADIIRIDETHR